MLFKSLKVVPTKFAKKLVETIVPGGYENHWLVRKRIMDPCIIEDVESGEAYVHPNLLSQIKADPQRLTIFLVGPCADQNPDFEEEAARLRALGHRVRSPVIVTGTTPQRRRIAITMMADNCDTAALLPGWTRSKDAAYLRDIAIFLGLDVRTAEDITESVAGA